MNTSYTTDTATDAADLALALADYGYRSFPGSSTKTRLVGASEEEVRRIAEDAGIAVSTEPVVMHRDDRKRSIISPTEREAMAAVFRVGTAR